MGFKKLCANLLLTALFLSSVKCTKLKKLERGINVLKAKVSTLEEKIYHDEFELRLEIDTIWRKINESIGYADPEDNPDVATVEQDTHSTGNSRKYNVDKLLQQVEARSQRMSKSFVEEKALLREYIKQFETDIVTMRTEQEHALAEMRNAFNEQSNGINDTMNDIKNSMYRVLDQKTIDLHENQNNDFVALNMSILEQFNELKQSVIEWNNFSMIVLGKQVNALKVNQHNALVSFMNKTLASFKDTIEVVERKARLAQELAARKATEFVAIIQTLTSTAPTINVQNARVVLDRPRLHMVALNSPYNGRLRGIRGADYLCHREARRSGMNGTFRAFLSSSDQSLDSLVFYPKDRNVPIVNSKDEMLFNSWNELVNGAGGPFNHGTSIYSFDGNNVNANPKWPMKVLWHGSDREGNRVDDKSCRGWSSHSRYATGIGSSLKNGQLMDMDEYNCSNAFVVLCIEITCQRRHGK